MKLNPDCIRDILLVAEEVADFDNGVEFEQEKDKHKLLKNYSDEELRYHLRQCDLRGLFYEARWYYEQCSVEDLSPAGHEFLENIRQDTVWGGVKDIAGKVGSTSLSSLMQISSSIITQLIKSQFGLP